MIMTEQTTFVTCVRPQPPSKYHDCQSYSCEQCERFYSPCSVLQGGTFVVLSLGQCWTELQKRGRSPPLLYSEVQCIALK